MMRKNIAIIGAGPAGLSLARLLSGHGLSTVLIEKQDVKSLSVPQFDGRDIAMTHLSKSTLTDMGVWQRFSKDQIHPLQEARVHNGVSPFSLQFNRTDNSLEPLGYLAANWQIKRVLYDAVSECNDIELLAEKELVSSKSISSGVLLTIKDKNEELEEVEADLIVAADNRFSNTRRMMGVGAKLKDYGRVMIVCNMKHEKCHNHIARENFYYGRTCATLPLGSNMSSVVITVPATQSYELCDMDDESFNREAAALLENRLGHMELVSERYSYPLVGVFSDRFFAEKFALVGDAAVGMHPVTAHGFNLGLRSTSLLAKLVVSAYRNGKDIASQNLLRRYQLSHYPEAKFLYTTTNALVSLFTNDRVPAKIARNAALRFANNCLPIKKFVSHRLTKIS